MKYYLQKNGFKKIKTNVHIMEEFSVKNWLTHSGLSDEKQKEIFELHVNAKSKIKDSYNMRIEKGDCLIRTSNVILSGIK